jgi:alkanesulfonate monooxygenase SsuD/methylene tetrahydromethanopterin reductase-like flavin-dependent oxidoreductase (luciferase family)
MRFNYFHLMPWPHLPDDFDDRFTRIALTFPSRYFDAETGNRLYHRYLDELEYAEELGFDAICVNEHHQTPYGLMPSPNLMAAALARRTSRVKIMVLGNAIGLRGNPLRIAEEIAMLDHLSNGRIVSGFVRGLGFEYFSHGINPTRSRARFNEAHDLIIRAWTSDEPFEWVSPNYEYRYVNVWPRPLQKPHPPVAVPGSGSRETMRWVAEHGYSYMSVFAPARVIKRWFQTYRDAVAEAGAELDRGKICLMMPVYVGKTDKEALAEAKPHTEWLFHKALKYGRELRDPPGYVSTSSLRGLLAANVKPYPQTTFQEFVENRQVLVGSPATVTEQLDELREEMGFGAFAPVLTVGDMPQERARSSMELFAHEVMPYFRRDGN